MVITRRALLAAVLCLAAFASSAQEKFITVASTTSTEQSGLFGYLLPIYEQQTGVKVRVVAPVRRSTSAGAATPMSCLCTPARRRKNSWPKGRASNAIR